MKVRVLKTFSGPDGGAVAGSEAHLPDEFAARLIAAGAAEALEAIVSEPEEVAADEPVIEKAVVSEEPERAVVPPKRKAPKRRGK